MENLLILTIAADFTKDNWMLPCILTEQREARISLFAGLELVWVLVKMTRWLICLMVSFYAFQRII